MKKTLFTGIIALLIVFGCGKNPTEPEKKPELLAYPSTCTFTREKNEETLIISNIGQKTLSWTINGMPEWAEFSKLQGTTGSTKDSIMINVNTNFQRGIYESDLIIESNGGNKTITLTMNLGPKTLTGNWTLDEGFYDGTKIENLKAWLHFKSSPNKYDADFEYGEYWGDVSGEYSYTSTTISSNLPSTMILGGYISSYTCCPIEYVFTTNMKCTSTIFEQFGQAAVIWTADKPINYSIEGDTLLVLTKDNTTLKYRVGD